MPLIYNHHHGSFFVKVGNGIGLTDGMGFNSTFNTQDPYVQPILRYLSGNTWVEGWMNVEDACGLYRTRGPSERVIVARSKPQFITYSSPVDRRNYGSILTDISAAGRLLRGESLVFQPGREHQVQHVSYKGDLSPVLLDDLFGPFDDSPMDTVLVDGTSLARPTNVHLSDWNASRGFALERMDAVNAFGGAVFTVNEDWYRPGWGYYCDLEGSLKYLESLGGISASGSFPWCYWTYDISNIVVSYSAEVVTVQFKTLWSECDFQYWWEYQCSLTLRRVPLALDPPSALEFDAYGNWTGWLPNRTGLSLTLDWVMTDRHPSDPPGFGSSSVGQVGHHDYNLTPTNWINVFLSRAVQVNGGHEIPDFTSFNKRTYLRDFHALVRERWSDIRTSSYISAGSALDDVSGGIDTNLVEAIGEAGELVTMLPDFIASVKVLTDLFTGQDLRLLLKVHSGADVFTHFVKDIRDLKIHELLDVLTSLRLQERFALRPNIDLIENVLPRLETVARRIQRLASQGEIYGHGVFRYEFPLWEFGRKDARLITHSTVLYRRDPKSLLEAVLGVRALGLLPSPSSLWELVPFSFVVDWFVDINSRLRDLESSGFQMLMDIAVYTHSYTVYSNLTDDELALDGFALSESLSEVSRPRLVCYLREISACVPTPRDSRYDFRLPGRLPNWATSGSLLWQLLFAK